MTNQFKQMIEGITKGEKWRQSHWHKDSYIQRVNYSVFYFYKIMGVRLKYGFEYHTTHFNSKAWQKVKRKK